MGKCLRRFGSGERPPLTSINSAPGPGAYDPNLGPGGPQYAMKGRHPASVDGDMPGPGQYNPPQFPEEPPNWTFGKDKRDLRLESRGVPGPGNYDPKLAQTAPLGSFGNESRSKTTRIDVPGPGAYEARSGLDKVAYSLSSRHYVPDKEERPGPGAYDPEAVPGNAGFRLGTAARTGDQGGPEMPGPGAYDPKLGKDAAAYG